MPPRRTIQDLRAQIIANATILEPRHDHERPANNHVEVILAKIHSGVRTPQPSGSLPPRIRPAVGKSGSVSGISSASEKQALATEHNGTSGNGQHYAVLVRRSFVKQNVQMLIKGEPRDTVEEALEWMLERTETEMHGMVVRYGKQASDGTCSVM